MTSPPRPSCNDACRTPLAIADNGNPAAQALAGGLFLEHFQQPSRARQYFELAASQGYPAGCRGLAFVLLNGADGEGDTERAIDLLTAAADAGDSYAAYNLGVLYRTGKSARPDEARARQMFQRAGELGLGAGAAVFAEYLAADGFHVLAREWNQRGVEAGSVVAMLALARSYQEGVGGQVDRVQAVRWYLKMLDWGDTRGVQPAIDTASVMSDDEVVEAARLAGRADDAQTLLERARASVPRSGR